MANRWCDGLGRYGGTKAYMLNGSSSQAWAEVNAGFSLTSANPSIGAWALRLDHTAGAKNQVRRVFGAALGEVFVGLAVYCFALPSTEPIPSASISGGVFLAKLCDASNQTQVSIYLGTDGAIVAYRKGDVLGSSAFDGTLLGRSVPCIGAGGRQHVEIYAKCHGSTGAIEVRVDEVTRLNLTGLNTDPHSALEFSQWSFGREGLTTLTAEIDFTDCYVNDTVDDGSACNTFIGDCKSGDYAPNADTAQADFALSTGIVGYSLLSERPPNDATLISRAAATGESDFALSNLPATAVAVLTTRPWIRASKDDAGTCTVAPNMKSGAVKGTVADQPIATAAAYYDSNVPLDPNTGVNWTPTTFNAAQLVVERIS